MLFLRGQVLAQFSEKLQNLATLICNVVDFEESKHLKRLAVLQGKVEIRKWRKKNQRWQAGRG
jgi:hypothetical protein